jgi:4'-phosphopantetheinyl transferase
MPHASSTRASPPSTTHPPRTCPPSHPRLADGAVHVWRADLAELAEDLGELLSPTERTRAERLAHERDRLLWTRAHGVLRQLLGRYLGRDPRTLRFSTGAHGKPALLDDPPRSPAAPQRMAARPAGMSFNLSHSGHLALYAFSAIGPVGVDVEVARRPIDELAVAARAFGPAEVRRLAELDPSIREQEFRRAWVRHEAALKCRGTGIGGAAAQSSGREPWIAELEVGPRAAGAVAAERLPRELRCRDWNAVAALQNGIPLAAVAAHPAPTVASFH